MFKISKTYMEHSGGTKFYRPILVQFENREWNSAATVIHFGPNSSPGSGYGGRPVRGGQVQVKPGATHYQGQIALKAKATSKGHYKKMGAEEAESFATVDAAREELIRLFGATTAAEVLNHLGFSHDGAELPPTVIHETVPIEPVKKPDHWASW